MRIDAINLFVKDIKNMVEFYRDVMLMETKWDGESAAEFNVNGIRLNLQERKELEELTGAQFGYPKGLNGSFTITVDCDTFEEVDDEFERVVELGAMPIMEPKTMDWGQRTSCIADPEGNLIEISSYNVFQLHNGEEEIEFSGIGE